MKVVIDIPEKDYKQGTLVNVFRCYSRELDNIIYNGTVLPKDHGRLIDEDEITVEEDVYNQKYIIHAPTIIEADADKEAEDNEITKY